MSAATEDSAVSVPSALLLAAGRATRLRTLRERYAKACVPVAGTSPLEFLLPRLASAGVGTVWINLHFRGEQVQELAEASAPSGMALRFLEEEALLGTGGTLLAVHERWGRLPDMVVNAKIFTDFDFRRILREPAPTVVLHTGSSLAEFGGLAFDGRRSVTELVRRGGRPRPDAAVFTGICRPADAWIPDLRAARRARPVEPLCLLRHALLPALAAGLETRALLHGGWWQEISTESRVADAAAALAARAAAP